MLRRIFVESGARRIRQRKVPRIMTWNQGRPVETLISSRVQWIGPAGVQLREGRSPSSNGCGRVVRETSTSGEESSEVGRSIRAAKTDAVSSETVGTEDGVDGTSGPEGTQRDDFE